MPGKTPVQARERVGLTRCSIRSDRLAIRRSPARTGWSDELFSRVPQCRRRLRAMLNFEGRNCRGRLHGHADAHAPTRRQIAPEGKAPYWPPDLVIDPQKKAPPKRGFFGGHMHGLDHSPRIHNAETRVLVSRLRAGREGRHPCVVTQEVDLLSSDATEYGQCSGSDSPCVGGALGRSAGEHPRERRSRPALPRIESGCACRRA